MMFDMLKYYDMIKKSNISIIYSGPLWSEGIEGIGGAIRKRLEFDELPFSASQSVFSVFIEQMNNMLMYSTENEQIQISEHEDTEVPKGVFVLGEKDGTYFLQSGNIMKSENTVLIKSRVDHLNTLDKSELRKFYKQQIKSENANLESKGAGLGLIEIARRASSKIEYTFTPLDDKSTFFSMFVSIG